MRKLWLLSIIAFACLATFTIVSYNHNQSKVYKSNSVDSSSKPARIISLAPNLTEILFALGLDEKIIAVSSDSDYPPQAAKKEKVGSFWQPNIEAIIACKPDLVVAESFEQQKAVTESLKKLGYGVLSLKVEKIEELSAAIQKIGTTTGCKQRADQLVENISGQLSYLKSKYSSTNRLKVLWVIQTEPLRVAGRDTFINELIELLGGENAIGPTIQHYPQIGTEELLVCNVEVIIQSAMGKTDIGRQQQQAEVFWGKWASLPAVKNNKIYVVNSDIVLRLGPRLPQGAETVGRCLYPDTSIISNETAQ
jgi:iron complex transport system substrate-binding protein